MGTRRRVRRRPKKPSLPPPPHHAKPASLAEPPRVQSESVQRNAQLFQKTGGKEWLDPSNNHGQSSPNQYYADELCQRAKNFASPNFVQEHSCVFLNWPKGLCQGEVLSYFSHSH